MTEEKYKEISCIEEWLERKGWSLDLPEEEQNRLEAAFSKEYAEVRALLWSRHYDSLDSSERARLDAGTHPSDSWKSLPEAQPYLDEFQAKFAGNELVSGVTMDRYHGDTIVFTVHLKRDLQWREYRRFVPGFYRGFQVFVTYP